jgi:hypothetical protein
MWFRKYVPLAVGVVVLVIGTTWLVFDDASPAAGVFVGAGLAIGVEGYRYVMDETRRERERIATAQHYERQDLEETRRLLYMALAVSDSTYVGSAELAGSIANSLAHHSKRLTEQDAERLARAIATAAVVSDTKVTDQIRAEIEAITAKLGDQALSG